MIHSIQTVNRNLIFKETIAPAIEKIVRVTMPIENNDKVFLGQVAEYEAKELKIRNTGRMDNKDIFFTEAFLN